MALVSGGTNNSLYLCALIEKQQRAQAMYLNPAKKAQLFAQHSPQHQATDTGSPESQVALFTYRINHLTEHLKLQPKDKSTQNGLLRLVGKRRKLLAYLQQKDIARYRAIIKELGIRR